MIEQAPAVPASGLAFSEAGLFSVLANIHMWLRSVQACRAGDPVYDAGRTDKALIPAIDRGPGVWELVPAGFSKGTGTGIDVLRKRLGISREQCYAFGDSQKDLSMFSHAGCSIAMGNAPEDVKAACTFVTDRPEEHGIRNAMKHFELI